MIEAAHPRTHISSDVWACKTKHRTKNLKSVTRDTTGKLVDRLKIGSVSNSPRS